METVITYLVKSSALLLLFFATYHFLLKRNTFFTSNRWFLLAGIFCAILMPLLSFQKTLWIEPVITTVQMTEFVPITEAMNAPTPPVETNEIPWEMVVAFLYGIGVLVFLTQLVIEFYSLRKIIKNNSKIQEDGFELIEVGDAISPFSFFKKIVYNRSLFQPEELQNIIEHEKIHARQMHSLDVLIARIYCILFWWNPLVWLYKKAMVQNLEFIADQNALAKAKDKKSYLLTLLKITTAEKHVAITNHFYQSLIKKRIVMLNKNQSKKYHSWKYFAVIPALTFFIATYQVEVVAQVKENPKTNIETSATRAEIMIESTSTDQEITDKLGYLAIEHNLSMSLKKIKRDKNGAIIAIKIILSDKNRTQKVYDISSSEPIKPFTVYVDTTENNVVTFGFDDARSYLLTNENSKNQKKVDSIVEAESISNGTLKILNSNAKFSVEINTNTTDEGLEQYKNFLYNEFELYLRTDKIKRNRQKEITRISLSLINKKDQITSYVVSGDDAIKPFSIYAGYDKDKKQLFGFGADSKNQHLKNHFDAVDRSNNNSKPKQVITSVYEKDGQTMMKTTPESDVQFGEIKVDDNPTLLINTIIILDGKVISKEEMQQLDTNSIKSVSVVKRGSNKSAEYGGII